MVDEYLTTVNVPAAGLVLPSLGKQLQQII
jgi:hypothetical protein